MKTPTNLNSNMLEFDKPKLKRTSTLSMDFA